MLECLGLDQPVGMNRFDPGVPYLTASPETVSWGFLPNGASQPVLTVPSGTTVCIDTVSHEGIMEDQGRDPVAFFGDLGVAAHLVLADAIELASSGIDHDPVVAGPHVVLGPIAVTGAQPGDVLEVEVLRLDRRADYGIISNRHGLGALPGEFPAPLASGEPPPPMCVMATVDHDMGVIGWDDRSVHFPLNPFLGIMGVAPATSEAVNSVPPGSHGGNLDVNLLGAGSRLYLPVQVPAASFYVSDPHFAQGDGEVALTAFEAPLRAWVRLAVHQGRSARALAGTLRQPFAEDAESWILIGLDRDLNEAMRQATRQAIAFLTAHTGMTPAIALAYLSAAADFEVSQVVDQVKGVHCVIRKRDFGPSVTSPASPASPSLGSPGSPGSPASPSLGSQGSPGSPGSPASPGSPGSLGEMWGP
jgi:acetamidase/formamidase